VLVFGLHARKLMLCPLRGAWGGTVGSRARRPEADEALRWQHCFAIETIESILQAHFMLRFDRTVLRFDRTMTEARPEVRTGQEQL
jgi:hypothetical protein